MYFSNEIIFDNSNGKNTTYEHYQIVKIESDSLVIKSPNSSSVKVYRKVSDTLKHDQRIEFIGKKFIWKNRKFQDTIYFKTDSRLFRMSDKNPINSGSSWERINFEGFDILLMDGDVPYVIINKDGKTINLRTFHKNNMAHTMIEIE